MEFELCYVECSDSQGPYWDVCEIINEDEEGADLRMRLIERFRDPDEARGFMKGVEFLAERQALMRLGLKAAVGAFKEVPGETLNEYAAGGECP